MTIPEDLELFNGGPEAVAIAEKENISVFVFREPSLAAVLLYETACQLKALRERAMYHQEAWYVYNTKSQLWDETFNAALTGLLSRGTHSVHIAVAYATEAANERHGLRPELPEKK